MMATALLTSLNQVTNGYMNVQVTKEDKLACAAALQKPGGLTGVKEFSKLMNSLSAEKRAELIINKLTANATNKLMEAVNECMVAIREDENVSKSLGITTEIGAKLNEVLAKKLGTEYASKYTAEGILKVLGNQEAEKFFADLVDEVDTNVTAEAIECEQEEMKGCRAESIEKARLELSEKRKVLVQTLLERHQNAGNEETAADKKVKFALLEDKTFKNIFVSELVDFVKTAPSERLALLAKYQKQLGEFEKSFETTVEKYAVLSEFLAACNDKKLLKKAFPQHTLFNPEQYLSKYLAQLVSNSTVSELPSRINFYNDILTEVFKLPTPTSQEKTPAKKHNARHNTYESFLLAMEKEANTGVADSVHDLLTKNPDELIRKFYQADNNAKFPKLDNLVTVANLKEGDDKMVPVKDGVFKTALAQVVRDRVAAYLMEQQE